MNSMMSSKAAHPRGMALLLLASSAGAALLVGGCGSPAKVAGTPTQAVQGTVSGGQQPVAGVKLQLYTAGTSGYGSAASTMGNPFYSNGSGGFYFSSAGTLHCPSSTSEAYLAGTGGTPSTGQQNPNLAMMVGLGNCQTFLNAIASPSSTYTVAMNELTTIASVWSLAPYMSGPTSGSPACTGFSCIGAPGTTMATTGLANAFASINEVVKTSTGQLQTSASYTLPINEINSLANILQSCINSGGTVTDPTGACVSLFSYTTTTFTPTDTVTAAMNIAQHPGAMVSKLYNLPIPSARSFSPALTSVPTDWTIAINYTGGGLHAPESIAADGNGNIWVTNPTDASSGPGSVTELSINNAATTTPVYAFSNYANTKVSTPYGVAIDTNNNAWITNQGNGFSITEIVPGATPTFSNFTGNGLDKPEGVAIDGADNLWVVNNGNSTLSGFTNAGAALTGSPYNGNGSGGLSSPSSIAVNPK